MKKIITLVAAIGIISATAFGQAPDKMSYQAIVRDAGNNLVTETTVGIQISILKGAPDGEAIYVETQTPGTNSNGLVSMEIGGGKQVSGNFEGIEWSTNSHFIKTEIDPTGGTSYTITSTSQLLSVPYAMHAETAGEAVGELKMQIEELRSKTGLYKVSDFDGNAYTVVRIGSQFWMAENLKSTKYNDGTAIPLVSDNTEWASLTTAGYCWHEGNELNPYSEPYGALYNWYAVNTGKLCPTDWHVPTEAEWITLADYLGGESLAGVKLKENGVSHWNNDSGATNESGFTALPGGSRGGITGYYCCKGDVGYWWSFNEENESDAWFRLIHLNNNFQGTSTTKKIGLSVRCVRD